MVYTFCPSCGTTVPDPALRFCPNCGGLLQGAPKQNRLAAPAAGSVQGIPGTVVAVCLFLVLVVAAILVQALPQHLVPVPAAANAGTMPPPSFAPEAPYTSVSVTRQAPHSPNLNAGGNRSDPVQPVNTILTMPAPPGVPASASPPMTIPGTQPYSSPCSRQGGRPGGPRHR